MKAMKCIANNGIGLALTFALLGAWASAQTQAPSNSQTSATSNSSASQGSSLGDYARQIKKSPASRPRVYDNDNLPREEKLSIVGTPAGENAAPAADESATPSDTNAATGKAGEKSGQMPKVNLTDDEATRQAAIQAWNDKLSSQKDQIGLLSRELDVLQREYQIRTAAFYADAGNRLRNQADWDKQDVEYKQQIADKQKALDDAKQKLDDTQEEARKAGVPSSVREP